MGGMVEELGEVGFEKVEVAGHGCNNIYTHYSRKIWSVLKLRVRIVYTTVHYLRQVTMLQKIGMRDFRDNLAKYLNSSTPVAILRHGQTVGYFLPTQLQPAESEQESLKRAAAALDTLLLEHGIDEDTLLAEFRQLRSSQS